MTAGRGKTQVDPTSGRTHSQRVWSPRLPATIFSGISCSGLSPHPGILCPVVPAMPLYVASGRWASTRHPSEIVSCKSSPGFRNQVRGLGNTMFKNHTGIYEQAPGGIGLLSAALCSPGSLGCSQTCFSFQSWKEAPCFKKTEGTVMP